MDYILRISGDFEKGECEKCPLLAVNNYYPDVVYCSINFGEAPCPLEEAEQFEEIPYEYNPMKWDREAAMQQFERAAKAVSELWVNIRGEKE